VNLLWKIRTALGWANRARSVALERNLARAEQGDPTAQYTLAERYHDGLGVPRDHAQAFAWFLRAAQQGHPRAQTNVGLMLFLGRGTDPDPVEAVKWITLALDQNDPKARQAFDRLRARLTPEQLEQGRLRAQPGGDR
jgi:uncharacterized protein